MNKRKPRGPVPSLIGGSNGKPKRVIAKKIGKCSRCHAQFVAGDPCIEIPKLGRGFQSNRRVCYECFGDILDKTKLDLEVLAEI